MKQPVIKKHWKNLQNKNLRVINFEKLQIAQKGSKRPKKKYRPNADLDKLKRPNWSQTTKNGNTALLKEAIFLNES